MPCVPLAQMWVFVLLATTVTLAVTAHRTRVLPVLFLDTDPSALVAGGLDSDDDTAFAFVRAHEFPIAGVTTTFGNNQPDATCRDFTLLLDVLKPGPPGPPVVFHCGGHLDSVRMNETTTFMADQIRAASGSDLVELVALGAMSNVAAFLRAYPALARERLAGITFLGGSTTDWVELNFASDVGAAQEVLAFAGITKRVLPFDVFLDPALGIRQSTIDQRCPGVGVTSPPIDGWFPCAALRDISSVNVQRWKFLRTLFANQWGPDVNAGFVSFDLLAVMTLSHPDLVAHWSPLTMLYPSMPAWRTSCVQCLVPDRFDAVLFQCLFLGP